jgi:hypothetical protein
MRQTEVALNRLALIQVSQIVLNPVGKVAAQPGAGAADLQSVGEQSHVNARVSRCVVTVHKSVGDDLSHGHHRIVVDIRGLGLTRTRRLAAAHTLGDEPPGCYDLLRNGSLECDPIPRGGPGRAKVLDALHDGGRIDAHWVGGEQQGAGTREATIDTQPRSV